MSTNQVMFAIAATPENAELINKVSELVMGADYTKTASAKEEKATTTSLEDFKAAAKEAKSEFGEEFAMAVLKDADVDVKTTLGRSIAAVDAEQYDDIMEAWKAGPQESDSDDLDDDDDMDDDDAEEADVDPDAVKIALKAYAKENGRDEAKELMSKHKVGKLSDVDGLKPAALAKLMEELV